MPNSAIPLVYWAIFGWYEPLLTVFGCVGAILYPKESHDRQAPWPPGVSPPESPLSLATLVTLLQLAHIVGLLGFINFFVLWAARRHLSTYPAIQEKIVSALLTPLLIGDVSHIGITLWALGQERWQFSQWRESRTLWLTMVTGFSLLLPRIAWHLGVGRYVHVRDGRGAHDIKRAL